MEPGVWVPYQIGQYGAPVPGQCYDDPRILFSGYIQQAEADQDSQKDTVVYSLATVDTILKLAGVHNIGYYHTTYKGRLPDGTPTTLNPSKIGKGQLVADLTSEDMYRSLLLDHSTIGQYHDVYIWRDFLPIPTQKSQKYFLTYSTLTANEGSIWDAMTTLAQNEYAQVWCERDGSIRIGPTYNLRGYEMLNLPTVYGTEALGLILNLGSELNNNPVKDLEQAYFLFQFGPNALPVPQDAPDLPARDLSKLVGPPVVCDFSDIPLYDQAASPPPGLFPWTTYQWPQDTAVHPMTTQVSENYTNRATFVKLIGTLVNGQNVWAGWYPIYTPTGAPVFDLSTGLMTARVDAGTWEVEDQLLLPDITAAKYKSLVWQYLWEMARRQYFNLNQPYQVTLHCGLLTFPKLHDLIRVTRQQAQDGPLLNQDPFSVTSVTHSIDLNGQTWTTDLVANQVTSFGLGPVITPPKNPPKS